MSGRKGHPLSLGAWFALLALAVSGCEEPGELLVHFRVEPAEVFPGDSLTATLSVVNTGRKPRVVRSGWGCIAFLDAYRDGEEVILDGTDFGCLAVIVTFEIPGEDSLVSTYPLRAWVLRRRPWDREGPAPPGTYLLRAVLLVRELPDAEARFVVRSPTTGEER